MTWKQKTASALTALVLMVSMFALAAGPAAAAPTDESTQFTAVGGSPVVMSGWTQLAPTWEVNSVIHLFKGVVNSAHTYEYGADALDGEEMGASALEGPNHGTSVLW